MVQFQKPVDRLYPIHPAHFSYNFRNLFVYDNFINVFLTTAFWAMTLRTATYRYESFGHTCGLHIEKRQGMWYVPPQRWE